MIAANPRSFSLRFVLGPTLLPARLSRLLVTSPYLNNRARVQCASATDAGSESWKKSSTTFATERPGRSEISRSMLTNFRGHGLAPERQRKYKRAGRLSHSRPSAVIKHLHS